MSRTVTWQVSLAVAPGEAAYIPVGHCAADRPAGGLDFGDAADAVGGADWSQAPLDEVLARLKPLLRASR